MQAAAAKAEKAAAAAVAQKAALKAAAAADPKEAKRKQQKTISRQRCYRKSKGRENWTAADIAADAADPTPTKKPKTEKQLKRSIMNKANHKKRKAAAAAKRATK